MKFFTFKSSFILLLILSSNLGFATTGGGHIDRSISKPAAVSGGIR